ncbi:hypothetical protein [Micromonospora endophytica]|uniref:Uncharacterized protein n=1 Tax=Micromonospora endophytica TaxID=515350 RepID=A0A2W2DMC9_9ACTN|nr:hypothetical protein [Micromonospora endophytica]PZF98286.1 hypothetical protein C1I93_09350 [Micromonospora endophytica]RIW42748.1 hypothetical protein D3H59_22195 [Micromonospora endophytica]BCJ62760.1 hypothetical protein Jiend_61820 [Micromonospora endophytica]
MSNEPPDLADQPAVSDSDIAEAGTFLVPATFTGMPPTAQLFWAVVESTGVLVRGFGVVSATRITVGQYQVVFSHDLTRSAYVGSIGLTGSVGASPSGQIAVVGRAGVPNGVFVQTFSGTGVAADRAFHLTISS